MVHVYSPVRASSEASLSTAGRGTDQAAVCRVSSRAAESECVGPPTGPQALEAFSVKVSRSSPSISSASPVVAAGTCTTSVTSTASAGISTASVCCVIVGFAVCKRARALGKNASAAELQAKCVFTFTSCANYKNAAAETHT